MEARVLKYAFINPKMNKKLFEENRKIYDKVMIFIRIDELNNKCAYLVKTNKPTKNGTKFTFKTCETYDEWEREFDRLKKDAEKMKITLTRQGG